MDQVILNLNEGWKLTYADSASFRAMENPPRTVAQAEAVGKPMMAEVPGDFLRELWKSGVLPDPYFGTNAWEYQKYEWTHVWYYRTFTVESGNLDRMAFDFAGLDTLTEIYLNGELIGKTDNMFIPHRVPAKGVRRGRNELVIHFIPVMVAAREKRLPVMCHTLFYSFEALYTRKPMHSYGWDIMPRILSCGIWKPVTLVEEAKDSIDELFLFTLSADPERRSARVRIYFALNLEADDPREYRIEIDGACGESRFREECCPRHTEYTRLAFRMNDCHLWWPKNQGEQALYDVTARLWHGDTLVDTKKTKLGIRTVTLSRTDAMHGDEGDFTFRVNGRPIFCMGTNWVPLSPFHCEDAARLPRALALLDDSGCNMVRVWGGSVYPDDAFYDFCDEHGILVWQDFAMACAVYPRDADFCRAIEEEATAVVKRLRQHPSLALWAGDNECDATCEGWNGYRRDPNDNILTRQILPEVVRTHDFTREYLPSSPYISPESYAKRLPTPEAHLWGPRRWFKDDDYEKAPCCFASEIGYHGCPSVRSLKKIIGEDHLWPIENEQGEIDLHWLAHTTEAQADGELAYRYRARLHPAQVKLMFGALPDNIETYSAMSQISQAEALKHFIELFRTQKWRRTGILWWNLLDGWPQVSDAAVGYDFEPKLAYYYIKRVQTPVCLMFTEPKDGKITLVAANDTDREATVSYRVSRASDGKLLTAGTLTVPANENAAASQCDADPDAYRMYLVEWELDGKTFRNHFCTGMMGMSYEAYRADLAACGLDELE